MMRWVKQQRGGVHNLFQGSGGKWLFGQNQYNRGKWSLFFKVEKNHMEEKKPRKFLHTLPLVPPKSANVTPKCNIYIIQYF